MAIPRARGGTSPSTRWSPMWISPAVGLSSPAIMRSSVVFPEPEEPSSTRNSPSRIERSTPSTAGRSPNCFLKFRISMPATVGALAPRLPAVRRRVGRLGEAHGWGINDAVRGLGHLERPQHVCWRGRRGCPPPPRGAPAAARRQHKADATHTHVHSPPSLPRGPIAWGVVRRRPTCEPIAKVVCLFGQLPFLEDRQRHRAHAPLAGAGREALLLQPPFELLRLGVGRDRPLQQVELDRQPDRVGSRVALAALAPALRRVERREQLAAHIGGAGRGAVGHAGRPAMRASSAYPGRSGRRYPRSRAATSRWTVIRSSIRIDHAAVGRTVATPFRYPLHVLQTSTLRVCSPSSGVR